jgi:predicted kinase
MLKTELELDELLVLAKEYGLVAVTCMLKYEKLLCKAREDTE